VPEKTSCPEPSFVHPNRLRFKYHIEQFRSVNHTALVEKKDPLKTCSYWNHNLMFNY